MKLNPKFISSHLTKSFVLAAALLSMHHNVLFSQQLDITKLEPVQPDPGLKFLVGLSWAMEGPNSPNFHKAVKVLEETANSKSGTAQLILGKMLIQKSESQFFSKGISWLEKASLNGEAEADLLLAQIYSSGGPGILPDKERALKNLEKSAQKGHQEAAYTLARVLDGPNATSDDILNAIRWYGVAAKAGKVSAQLRLGYLYLAGLNINKDEEEAAKWYSLAAEEGNLEATFNLAQIYDFTETEIRDPNRAKDLYKQAADSGHTKAKLYYGQKLLKGEYNKEDFKEALKYLTDAADEGNADAAFQSGIMSLAVSGNTEEAQQALSYLEMANKNGIPQAAIELGRIYYFGHSSLLKPAPDKAMAIYTQLASSGNKEAQALLGYIHQNGDATDKDINKAANWYLKAAQEGSSEAQYNLGMLYFGGQGIPQNKNEALRWLTTAAKNGHSEAALNIGVLYEKLNDQTKAAEWLRKAAEKGDQNAALYLGILFDESLREDTALNESLKWFRAAAKSGNKDAQYLLGYRLLERPNPRENLVESYQWFKVAKGNGHPEAGKALVQLESKLVEDELIRATTMANQILDSIKN